MGTTRLFLIALGLSMDAFAVSVCKGLSTRQIKPRHYLAVGLWFGGFQALMPAVGYVLGSAFVRYIEAFDHWIAFGLLTLIGIGMIREAFSEEQGETSGSFAPGTMALLAVATSVDALAVGITLAVLPDVRIAPALALIGATTFLISMAGLRVGNVFGLRFRSKAELAGGGILILIGLQILLEHLGVLSA